MIIKALSDKPSSSTISYIALSDTNCPRPTNDSRCACMSRTMKERKNIMAVCTNFPVSLTTNIAENKHGQISTQNTERKSFVVFKYLLQLA